jgi:uncharacterized protein YdaL
MQGEAEKTPAASPLRRLRARPTLVRAIRLAGVAVLLLASFLLSVDEPGTELESLRQAIAAGWQGDPPAADSMPNAMSRTTEPLPAQSAAAEGPRVLVLYDEVEGTPQQKLGLSYAIMLRNLLGHFDAQVEFMAASRYQPGSMEQHAATFYLGTLHNAPLPAGLVQDATRTRKPLVWFKDNLWKLPMDGPTGLRETRGITFAGIRGFDYPPTPRNPSPGYFNTVKYKDLSFVKFYRYTAQTGLVQADPEVGMVRVVDPARASVVVTMAHAVTEETAPYIVRSGNFWYVADAPFSFIGPRDRYIVFADLLHDMLGIDHAQAHRAMIRLEDIHAMVNPKSVRRVVSYLHDRSVPFSLAVIPHYRDPFGTYNGGTPNDIPLARARSLKRSLDYAVKRGGEVVAHGYTHQYANRRNGSTGTSGEDYEFWDAVHNLPLPEDSPQWAEGRLRASDEELRSNGYMPVAWTTPHYHASPATSRAIPRVFDTTYQRVVYFTSDRPNLTRATGRDYAVWQFFPYVIQRDHYGQRVLPENLGNVQYLVEGAMTDAVLGYTAADVLLNARYALAVRDGFASFFFHPFLLDARGVHGMDELTQAVEGITALGFEWTSPTRIAGVGAR